MNSYNTHLTKLREKHGLSLKEAAKGIGITRIMLYFYENGYFRPRKKVLKKIEKFYGTSISLEGDSAYPAPTEKHILKKETVITKVRKIVFGALAGAFLLTAISGGILFNQSVNNHKSYYGEVYNEVKNKVQENGDLGHDLVTSMEYRYIDKTVYLDNATVIFYESDNILYFNECTFSTTLVTPEFGTGRFHYHFGSNLGIDSSICEFTFGSLTAGTYFNCQFDYDGAPIKKVEKINTIIKGDIEITEDVAVEIVNSALGRMEDFISLLLTDTMGKEVSFYNDFIPAREQGRKINFALQIVGLILIFSGIIGFFLFIGIFLHLIMKNVKPRLVQTEPKKERETKAPLPKDFNIEFGIPDIFVIVASKILQYGTIALLLVAFLAKVGLFFPAYLSNQTFLTFLQLGLLTGIFLEHFIIIGRLKKPTTLFSTIILNVETFLFIATIETVLISLTNAWGYDMASLVYKYVPSNVYQVVALHYLIYLFLFFQPSFLKKDKKWNRILWHSLSLIPLGALIASYFLSNSYALVYGVKENIFVNFWFPNGFLPLSIVCVLFLYITFAFRLFYEKKFGQHKAQYFFYGDRYGLYENLICAGLILIVGLLDLFFRNNQYAYYIGLGSNEWVFTIIPLIILCKYSPNSQQIFLINEEEQETNQEEAK